MPEKPAWRKKEERLGYILLIPGLIVVLGLVVFPLLYTFNLSFHDVTLGNLGANPPFIGLQNFEEVIHSPEFLSSLKVNLIFGVSASLLATGVAVLLALLMNRSFRGRSIVRSIFIMPYAAPMVATAIVWVWMLDPNYGVVNWSLIGSGLISKGILWTSVDPYALITLLIYSVWRVAPFSALLILAPLISISKEQYEMAKIDGAGRIQKFRKIQLPVIAPMVKVVFLLRFMWEATKFGDIYVLTGGMGGTRTLPLLTYRYAFELFDLGKAAATSLILFIILVGFMGYYFVRVFEW